MLTQSTSLTPGKVGNSEKSLTPGEHKGLKSGAQSYAWSAEIASALCNALSLYRIGSFIVNECNAMFTPITLYHRFNGSLKCSL